MANWQCASCKSENLAEDELCGTCLRPKDDAASTLSSGAGGLKVETRADSLRGNWPAAETAHVTPPYASPPAPAHSPARVALGWGASAAILAGLYFGYRYLQEHPLRQPAPLVVGEAAPQQPGAVPGQPGALPGQTPPQGPIQAPPTDPGTDYAGWARAASNPDLRAAIADGGPARGAAQSELNNRERQAWQTAQNNNTIEAVVGFLQTWPSGSMQSTARARLSTLLSNLPMSTVPTAVANEAVVLREAPVANARTLRTISAGEVVYGEGLVTYGGSWIVVRVDGRRGYAPSNQFRVYRGASPPPPPPPPPPAYRSPPPPPPPVYSPPPPPAVSVRQAEILTMPTPEYPERARRGTVGVVRLSMTVTARGEITNVTIVSESPSGMGFGRSALNAMRNARARPRRENGVAVTSTLTTNVTIRAPD